MSLPVRTPRGSKSQRQRPYGRGGHGAGGGGALGPQSSSGFLGAIKSVVTAPLAWFGGHGDQVLEETGEKRRHHSPPEQGSLPPTAKRARHHSPPPAPAPPIGDPPATLFPAGRARSVLTPSRSFVTRSQSLALPPANGALATSRSAAALDRQMSVDAPAFGARDSFSRASAGQLFVTRGQSLSHSQMRDASMGPPRSPSRIRATMTPQPSGATFGPLPPRKSRDPSAPPLLAGTIDSRRSPFKSAIPRTSSISNFATTSNFGSSVSLAPTTSNPDLSQMPWNKKLTTSHDADAIKHSAAPQLNAADIALQKLENYRTPLLPSRPNAPSPVLARLKPKKVHVPIPMPEAIVDDWAKAAARDKHKLDPKTARMVHPYSGESGLKRLLARQRVDDEPTGRKEIAIGTDPEPEVAQPAKKPLTAAELSRKASVMEVDDEEAPKLQPLASRIAKEAPKPASAAAPRAPANQPGSSLRAPKAMTKRTHVSSKNKFSAVSEDDDDALAGLPTEEELLAVKPVEFKIPQGFAFSKPAVPPASADRKYDAMDTSAAPTPPVSAFPPPVNGSGPPIFKPTEPLPTPAPAPVSIETPAPTSNFFATPPAGVDASKTAFPVPTPAPEPKGESIPASIFSSSFSSAHPTADTANPMAPAEKLGNGNAKTVPSFFSSVPAFTPAAAPAKTPDFGSSPAVPLFGAPAAAETKQESKPAPVFGAPPATNGEATATKTNAFSFPPAPASAPAAVEKQSFSFGPSAPTPAPAAEKKEDAPKPLFGGFTAPSTTTPTPAPIFAGFGNAAKAPAATAPEPAKQPFTFGTPAPASKPDAAKLKTPPQTDSGEMRMEESPERTPSAATTNAFASSASSGFSFGASKPSLSGFGAPPSGASTPFSFGSTLPAADASKPATAAPFSFGASSGAAAKPAGFAFGAPAADTKPATTTSFSFGQATDSKPATPTGAPSFQFGAAPAAASKPASSAPFAFGSSTADASKSAASPFAFGGGAPPASGFAFGAPKVESAPREQSPFSAPASPFAAPTSNPFGAPAAPAPAAGPSFSFAAPAGMNNPFAGSSAAAAAGGTPPPGAGGFGFSIGAPDNIANRDKRPMPRRRNPPRR